MSRLLSNSLYNILSWIVPIIFTFIVIPMANNKLGTSTYGVYLILTTIIGFIGVLNFGTSEALISKLSGVNFDEDKEKVNELLNSSIIINIITCIIFILIAIVGGSLLLNFFVKGKGINYGLHSLLIILSLSSAINFLTNNYNSFFKAMQKYKIPSITLLVTNVIQNLLIIFALELDLGIKGMIYAVLISNLLQLAISISLVKYHYKAYRFSINVSKVTLVDMFHYSKYSFLVGILNIILLNSDKLFISYFFSEAEVTYYSVPSNLSIKIQQFMGVALHAIFPFIGIYYSQKNFESLKKLFKRTFKYIVLFVVSTSIPAIIYSDKLLLFWMGSEFSAKSTMILQISILSYELLAFSALPYFFFYGMNLPKRNFIFSLLSGSLTMIFNLIFIPKLGGLGAALATLVSCSVSFIALDNSRKLVNLDIKELFKDSVGYAVILGLIQIMLTLLLRYFIINLMMVFISGFISLLVFYGAYFLFGFADSFEKEKLKAIVKRIKIV